MKLSITIMQRLLPPGLQDRLIKSYLGIIAPVPRVSKTALRYDKAEGRFGPSYTPNEPFSQPQLI